MTSTLLKRYLHSMSARSVVPALLACLLIVAMGQRTCWGAAPPESIPDMLERTLPAIVTIGVYKTEKIGTAYGFAATASDVAYQKSLEMGGVVGSGSGFVVGSKGKKYIVTNAHVIDMASDDNGAVVAFTINRTKYPVRIVGADTFYDVAVLEFTDPQPGAEVGTVAFRSEETRIGEQVFAIGNPLGDYPYTVTQGIIGGKNRVRDGMTGKFGYLQSSATTIWGNSGGPLIDAAGRVVGINSQIEVVQKKLGTFVQPQLNFALEAGIARRVVNDLIEKGRVGRAYLGIAVTQSISASQGVENAPSPRIAGTVPGAPSAAPLAGREGYALLKVNGVAIRNVEEALGEFEKVRPGATVLLELENKKERTTVSITAGELTDRRHGDLAAYFLRSFASLDLDRDSDRVVITPSANCSDKRNPVPCRKRVLFKELDTRTDDYDELDDFYDEYKVDTAGVIMSAKDENFTLWKVHSPATLGLVIRLTALNGFVSLDGSADKKKSIVTLLLSDNGKNILRSLLY